MKILKAINEIIEKDAKFYADIQGKRIEIFKNKAGGIGTNTKATLAMSKDVVEAEWEEIKPKWVVIDCGNGCETLFDDEQNARFCATRLINLGCNEVMLKMR